MEETKRDTSTDVPVMACYNNNSSNEDLHQKLDEYIKRGGDIDKLNALFDNNDEFVCLNRPDDFSEDKIRRLCDELKQSIKREPFLLLSTKDENFSKYKNRAAREEVVGNKHRLFAKTYNQYLHSHTNTDDFCNLFNKGTTQTFAWLKKSAMLYYFIRAMYKDSSTKENVQSLRTKIPKVFKQNDINGKSINYTIPSGSVDKDFNYAIAKEEIEEIVQSHKNN